MRRCAKQTIFLFVLARNQRPELEIFNATGSGVGKAGPREARAVEKGTQRRQLAKGDAKGELTPDSRRDQSAWDGVQEQWGKTSQDESAFLMALWKFREGCTSALVYRCTGNAVSRKHPSCTWVNLSPYCSFVLCSFSSTPPVVFLVTIKKCVMPLLEPFDESPAKTELFKEVDKYGGPKGYCHSTPSLPSIPYPLWPGVVAPDSVLSKGQIELFDI